MAARTLWKFVLGRAKTFFKNYNVVERAEKIMEGDKRAPPRHPGTEAKFKVLIKERPEILEDMEKKPVQLLDRLKIVKVSSGGAFQEDEKGTKPLPKERTHQPPPAYGFEEPKIIPEGRCTLRQALEFITSHQNDPEANKIDSIAKAHNMKVSDVENIVNNFRVFELYVPRDKDITLAKTVLQSLGTNRVKKEFFAEPFASAKSETATEEEKKIIKD